ncbi:hypothetical protein MHPYR_730015 [uncultured Mycobacterium sp.]|uniref:Resolvase/invertase-type recombinase catalytic domain-containing protein n=1 Tax=uncultured Mycobacterium sp. TaxID=171292 RepID=A0A1Y5PPL5_9MYCO|nr:hypothetical protein MHPYR_730015 [uncultured Mycobacterium sp.]
MGEPKVTTAHRGRAAVVYIRQSTVAQISRNRESTGRQYDLAARAAELGWPRSAGRVIDDDLRWLASTPPVVPGSPSSPLRSGCSSALLESGETVGSDGIVVLRTPRMTLYPSTSLRRNVVGQHAVRGEATPRSFAVR